MTTVNTGNTVSPELLATMNPKSTSATSGGDAQNRFMTMLVAQMKNQDPLNPLDNAQVTSQLAQLSTVTGIDKLNSTLTSMQSTYQMSQSLQAAGMIGHNVLAPGSTMNLSNGKAAFGLDLASPADDVKVAVLDASKKVVRTMDLGAKETGLSSLQWDGTTDDGNTAADGVYTFKVSAVQGGKDVSSSVTALAIGQVSSVTTGGGGVKLTVPNIGDVSLADVRQIQ